MTRHVFDGATYNVVHSDPAFAGIPVEKLTGRHWSAWVFDIQEAHIALPTPWGVATLEDHHDLLPTPGFDLRRTRVAVVIDWPDGYLRAGGTGRLYFDPSAAVTTTQQAQAQLDQYEQGQFDVNQPPAPEPRQLAMLNYLFKGFAGGPLGVLRSTVQWKPSRVAPITIGVNYSEENGEDYQEFDITVGTQAAPLGELRLRPLWSSRGRRVRLLNAEPEFRDDIWLAEDQGSKWVDPEFQVADPATAGSAEMSCFHWKWPATKDNPITADIFKPTASTAAPSGGAAGGGS